ncbi:MAG: hypothetical protein AAF409_11320 [Pseudomonadota bacterium]
MDLLSLLTAAFDVHRTQIMELENKLRTHSFAVTAEVSLEIERDWRHSRLYTADFLVVDEEGSAPRLVELSPVEFVDHPPIQVVDRGVELEIRELVWDRVRFVIGGRRLDASDFDDVLSKWHWSWEEDDLPLANGNIHSVTMTGAGIGVDFGSASPEAFLDVLETLANVGISRAVVVRDK